jgi:hypothetical protein
MATLTAYAQPDYQNSLNSSVSGAQGTLASGTSSGVITVGQRRLLHLSAINTGTTSNRCAISYTLGNSAATGPTTAPTPVAASPFFLGDEGWIIDTGFYDQINLANLATYNGASAVADSVSILSKF